MYVVWLYEFVGRFFIEGPLKGIKVLENGFIKIFNNIDFQDFFKPDGNNAKVFIAFSVVAVIIGLIVFVTQFIKIFGLNNQNTSRDTISILKNFGLFVVALLIFPIIFNFLISTFAFILTSFLEVIGKQGQFNFNLYGQLNGTLKDVFGETGGKPVGEQIFDLNFFFAILLVFSVLLFTLWISWSIIQKIIEIIILYLAFPFFMSASVANDGLSRNIWIREILNKMLTILVVCFAFLLFKMLLALSNPTLTKIGQDLESKNAEIIIKFLVYSAIAMAIVSFVSLINKNNKQYSGIFYAYSSFKQTNNFVKKNTTASRQAANSSDISIPLQPINSNVSNLRQDIKSLKNSQPKYDSVAKINTIRK